MVATIHYINDSGVKISRYFDFVSSYLSHNHIYYEKCYQLLFEELKNLVPRKITRIINVTDGGNHFVSRYAFWHLAEFANNKGILLLLIFINK